MMTKNSIDRYRPRICRAAFAKPASAVSLALAWALTLSACGPRAPIQHCESGNVTRLYLGQTTPGGLVTDAQWQQFVAETVTPRFPDGFTVLNAQGQWRGRDGAINQESTRVLEIVHHDDPQSRAGVQALAHAYKRRFSQMSVLTTQVASYQCS